MWGKVRIGIRGINVNTLKFIFGYWMCGWAVIAFFVLLGIIARKLLGTDMLPIIVTVCLLNGCIGVILVGWAIYNYLIDEIL